MENFGKTAYIFLSTFKYHKHELEIARFGARAPRARAVDVKRLIYIQRHFAAHPLATSISPYSPLTASSPAHHPSDSYKISPRCFHLPFSISIYFSVFPSAVAAAAAVLVSPFFSLFSCCSPGRKPISASRYIPDA